jgi:hypothetical protein
MITHDIEGTRPVGAPTWQTRDNFNVHDIEGARPKPEKMFEKPNFHDPKDINRGEAFVSKRVPNPLSPEYIVRDEDGNIMTIGDIQGSRPKQFVNHERGTHDRQLNIYDIEGARPNQYGVGNI